MSQNKKNNINSVVYFFVSLVTMILFDIVSTNHILHHIFVASDNYKLIDIVYVQNTGAAFSSFQHSTLFLIIISILVMLVLLYELFKDKNKYSLPIHFASAMLTAGILCNTYERITLGYVRDFISLKFIDFPVFNISDIFINLAVLVIMILVITKKYKRNV